MTRNTATGPPYPLMHVARPVTDGENLRLGDLLPTAHSTPGHTKGKWWISGSVWPGVSKAT